MLEVIGDDCIGSYKSNYHTMTPIIYGKFALTCINLVRKLSVNVLITINNFIQFFKDDSGSKFFFQRKIAEIS
jgi:hypothetical protein